MKLAGKYEIKTHPFFVAQVNPNTKDDDFKEISGYDIYFMASVDGERAVIISPIRANDLENYWKEQFKELKHFISDDFKECLEIMLSGEETICASVPISELINFRYLTEADLEEMEDSTYYLIEKYNLDRKYIERCWKGEDEEEREENV